MRRAEVFVNIPVKRVAQAYSYRVPETLSRIDAGWRVVVPFGGRRVEGFVVETSQGEDDARLQDILEAVDDEAWFTPGMTEAARRLAEFYLCPVAEIMRLFMPGKSGVRIETRYEASDVEADSLLWQEETYRRIYEAVRSKGSLRLLELRREIPELSAQLPEILDAMLRRRWLKKTYAAKKRTAELYREELQLTEALTEEKCAAFRRRPAQLRLLEALAASGGKEDVPSLLKKGFSRAVIRALAEAGAAKLLRVRVYRDSYRPDRTQSDARPSLSDDQKTALRAILPVIEQGKYEIFLLHGVTGSGKTRVYLETAAKARSMGKQAVVLVPEIALTGHLVQVFRTAFPDDLIVIHSRLSVSERNDAFFKIRRGDAGVVIG